MDAKALERASDPLEELINRAVARGDWEEALELTSGLISELSNTGMNLMLASMMDELETFYRRDSEEYTERVQSALQCRDGAKTARLLAEKRERHRASHDRYVDFMAQLMSMVTRNWGQAGLEEMLKGVADKARDAMFGPAQQLSFDDRVNVWAKALRNHLGHIDVTEDPEKVTIRQDPCGSGGRLMRSGAYDGENALARVTGEMISLGAKDFPVYCTHCPVWLGERHKEWFGAPEWILTPPANNTAPCIIHFYKDKAKIPPDYLKKLDARAETAG
jgi:hypothetical protein